MRHSGKILATVVALSLLTGCSSFQVAEAKRSLALGLLDMAFEVATGGPKERWAPCPANREITTNCHDQRTFAEVAEEARLKSLREDAHYKAEADEIMQALDDTERRSGHPPVDIPTRDYEREDLEREERRKEALDNQAEFDEFMQALDGAEQQPDGPPLASTFSE